MANSLIIISDIHGCYKTLIALVEKARAKFPDGEIILLGDLIDRGPDSKSVVEWVIKNKIPTVLGNHEHLCIDCYSGRMEYPNRGWKNNGGNKTIKSFHGRVPREIVAWMATLPTYIIHPNYPELLISHTGHGLNPIKVDAIWDRSQSFPKDNYYRVFGHTPVPDPIINDTWAAIDTGCAYNGIYGDKLTAFVWPSKEIVQQDNIDND